jgi:hypothetical protein
MTNKRLTLLASREEIVPFVVLNEILSVNVLDDEVLETWYGVLEETSVVVTFHAS